MATSFLAARIPGALSVSPCYLDSVVGHLDSIEEEKLSTTPAKHALKPRLRQLIEDRRDLRSRGYERLGSAD
jgi:hypothetical protein